MQPEKTKWKPVPLAMDDDLKREVESVAKKLGQKQASVMRDAIRKGLPLLGVGGAADVLTVDSETSNYADRLAEQFKRTRKWVLLEAIRYGLSAVEMHLADPRTLKELVEESAGVDHPKVRRLENRIDGMIEELNRLEKRLIANESAKQVPASTAEKPRKPKAK